MIAKSYMDYLLICWRIIWHIFETTPDKCSYYLPIAYTTLFILGIHMMWCGFLDICISKYWRNYRDVSLCWQLIIFIIKIFAGFCLSEIILSLLCFHCTYEIVVSSGERYLLIFPAVTIQKYPTLVGYLLICWVFFGGLYYFEPVKEKIKKSFIKLLNIILSPNNNYNEFNLLYPIYIRTVDNQDTYLEYTDSLSDEQFYNEIDDFYHNDFMGD
ncbi:uncharacterized protein LOC119672199 [Teleopsis dalmanni]|uniref:uncharacterized protein LOC119672199 n=1 Tax=Teleopsis dalmanni TaxID=139649 RepID=UPI0018CDD932|nr:uncharacterized protein LOC119672199 [Teleopsis dalmanni]